MEISDSIKKLIKNWEGCRLKAYVCPAGVLTIGYGHTGPDVRAGMVITQKEADRLFDEDLQKFAGKVMPAFKGVSLKQCQADALISLSYNIGSLGVKAPTLVRKVKNNPDDPTIRDEFMKHVNARVGGVLKRLPGLVSRRQAEANHYFSQS